MTLAWFGWVGLLDLLGLARFVLLLGSHLGRAAWVELKTSEEHKCHRELLQGFAIERTVSV